MKNARETFFDKIKNRIFTLFGKRREIGSGEKPEEGFTIISCNCIAGITYHNLNMEFLTPTINLYIEMPDFLNMCLNLEEYMHRELLEADDSMTKGHPVGVLGGDVRIHFLHYNSFDEAFAAWERRKQRINYDKIFVIITDRDGFEDHMLEQLDLISYPKVFFSHKKPQNDYTVFIKCDRRKKTVGDLTRFVNLRKVRKYEYYFDMNKWLTGKYSIDECLIN